MSTTRLNQVSELRTEQEASFVKLMPKGWKVEHGSGHTDSYITYPSGVVIGIDWNVFEEGNVNCISIDYPIDVELATALKKDEDYSIWFEEDDLHITLRVDEQFNQLELRALMNILNENLQRKYGKVKQTILDHPWSDKETIAEDILDAWIKHIQNIVTHSCPNEAPFLDPEKRAECAKTIIGFTEKKKETTPLLERLWFSADKIARELACTNKSK